MVLLALLTTCSLLLNLSFFFSASSDHASSSSYGIGSINATLERSPVLNGLDHLIVVPGHAIWHGSSAEEALDERAWVLESYQRGGGRVETFFKHISAACVVFCFSLYDAS